METSINIYPNPAKDVLNILTNSEPATLKLYDVNGRLVKQQQVAGRSVQKIQVGFLKSGLYLLKIETAARVTTKKIVIQN